MSPSNNKNEKPVWTASGTAVSKSMLGRAKSKLSSATTKMANTINEGANHVLQHIVPGDKEQPKPIYEGWNDMHTMTLSLTSVHSLGEPKA
ncbi:hypothetical protein TruAng_001674 [Truncatella angustata]|nr:hypothetical protein TruAng_001674 [Truncatella angustata]